MALIGNFTPAKDGGWAGRIRTLVMDAKVRLVPNDNQDSENAPAFLVLIGHSRVGDAWQARSGDEVPKEYLRLMLDDPCLAEPLSAALFPSDDGTSAELVWKRR